MSKQEVCVYRRPGCMFCQQVEELLEQESIPFDTIEVADKAEQAKMSKRHGALSFPLVMVGDQYVGGFTHVVQLHAEGRLKNALLGNESRAPASSPGLHRPTAPQAPKTGSMAGYAALGRLLAERDKK